MGLSLSLSGMWSSSTGSADLHGRTVTIETSHCFQQRVVASCGVIGVLTGRGCGKPPLTPMEGCRSIVAFVLCDRGTVGLSDVSILPIKLHYTNAFYFYVIILNSMMETSYLKLNPFRNRCPEWIPNLHSDCCPDSNPCSWGSLHHQSAYGSTVLNV